MDRKLQRHRADSLRQHGFLVISVIKIQINRQQLSSFGRNSRLPQRQLSFLLYINYYKKPSCR